MSYIDYINIYIQDSDLKIKLLNISKKINMVNLPYNFVLHKSLETLHINFNHIPKTYDEKYEIIFLKTLNNNMLNSKTKHKNIQNNANNTQTTYSKYLFNTTNLLEQYKIPDDTKQVIISYFEKAWHSYIAKFSDLKFVSPDFLIRKILQNIHMPQFLDVIPRMISDTNILNNYEQLWKQICNDINIIYFN